MTGLAYLLEANASVLLFAGLYRLGLARLTFFGWNRAYLVGTLLLSLLLPFGGLLLPPLGRAATWPPPSPMGAGAGHPVALFLLWDYLVGLGSTTYWLVAGYHLGKLALDVRAVGRLAQRYPSQAHGRHRLVWVPDPLPTSSFFHLIFLNKTQCRGDALVSILQHELAHSRQWHTLDWLLVRGASALLWCNPVLAWWQRAVALNHEYLADAQTVITSDPFRYAHLLVRLATQSTTFSTLSHFSHGHLKSRILMLHQLRTNAVHRLRFLIVAPLTGLLLAAIACSKAPLPEAVVPVSTFVRQDLVGTWANTNRTTINDNDGRTPRDFPDRAGDVRVCQATVVFEPDGRFYTQDARGDQRWSGTWQRDAEGKTVRLTSTESVASQRTVSQNEGASGAFAQPVVLDVASLEAGRMAALQPYSSSAALSGGHVYYEYQKQ